MNSKKARKIALIYLNELKKDYYKNAINTQEIIELDKHIENRTGIEYQISQRMQIFYNQCFEIFSVVRIKTISPIFKTNIVKKKEKYPRVRKRNEI